MEYTFTQLLCLCLLGGIAYDMCVLTLVCFISAYVGVRLIHHHGLLFDYDDE